MKPVFADFGIAVILQTTVHRGASIVGTCNYMAPEAFEVEGIGKHTGVWALACVIVEMSTGQRPWADMQMQQIMMETLREHPVGVGDSLPYAKGRAQWVFS